MRSNYLKQKTAEVGEVEPKPKKIESFDETVKRISKEREANKENSAQNQKPVTEMTDLEKQEAQKKAEEAAI